MLAMVRIPLLTDLGSALLNQAKYPEAEQVYRRNLKLKERKLGPEHPDTLMVAMNLGSVLKEMGHFAAAEKTFGQNLITKSRVLGHEHLDTCFAALNLQAVWGELSLRRT